MFTNVGNKAVCLLCQETVAVFEEYNLKRHYHTKHADFGHNLSQDERKKKSTDLIQKLKKQQTVSAKQSSVQEAATEASFVLCYNIIKHNKPFSDGEFVKDCMLDAAKGGFPLTLFSNEKVREKQFRTKIFRI